MRNLFLFINLFIATSIFAQNYGTVSGTIVDSDNNPISFANVFIENLKKVVWQMNLVSIPLPKYLMANGRLK